MKLPTSINQKIIVLIIVLAFSSCYQPKEGCLDINAKNFDVAADDSCCDEESCCCEYPDLKFNVNFPLNRDTNLVFNMGEPYSLDGNHYFSVDSIAIFLSDIYLINEKGERFSTSDSVLVLHANDTSFIKDDIALIRRNQFEYSIGKFQYVEQFVGMECKLGLLDEANYIHQDSLSTSHPLANKSEKMYNGIEQGFNFSRMVFHRDTLPSSPSHIVINTNVIDLSYSFKEPLNFDRGDDVFVKISIYLLNLFENVDFGTDSDALIGEKIKQNLEKSIVTD